MNPNYPLVAERASHHCEYCHAPEVVFNVPFEIDHIIPVSQEGFNKLDNLALACRSCNLWKSNAVNAIDPTTSTKIHLFNPRQHKWSDHFFSESEPPFRLKGITPVGRATIAKLRMNKPLQLVARSHWIMLGIFP